MKIVAVKKRHFSSPLQKTDKILCLLVSISNAHCLVLACLTLKTNQELHDNIEQPARLRAQSGRFAAYVSRSGCSS